MFLADKLVCAARMAQIEKVYARAEVTVSRGRLQAGDDSHAIIDLPRFFDPTRRLLNADVHFVKFTGLQGRVVKVDQILTRAEARPEALHLLPAFAFLPGRQAFSHLIELEEYQAYLLDPDALAAAGDTLAGMAGAA